MADTESENDQIIANLRKRIGFLEKRLVDATLANERLELVNAAVAEKIRLVTIERDRYFDMKRYNAGRFAEVRAELHNIRHEAQRVLTETAPTKLLDEIIELVKRIANNTCA